MNQPTHACCGPGYASREAAMKAEREKILNAIALYTRVPESKSQII
jgi:selenium-binding protein 1